MYVYEASPSWPCPLTAVQEPLCVCWACHEGSSYVKVRDAAAAVLVDRTRPDRDVSSAEGSVSPEVQHVSPQRWL